MSGTKINITIKGSKPIEVSQIQLSHWLGKKNTPATQAAIQADVLNQLQRLEATMHQNIDDLQRDHWNMNYYIAYVNTENYKASFNIGDRTYIAQPGDIIQIPSNYTPDTISDLAPQMKPKNRKCEACQQVIGSASLGGEIVDWEHNAPCGLHCRDEHIADHVCRICKPKTCPKCKGARYNGQEEKLVYSDNSEPPNYTSYIPEFTFIRSEMCAGAFRYRHVYQKRLKCNRCVGHGIVSGRSML